MCAVYAGRVGTHRGRGLHRARLAQQVSFLLYIFLVIFVQLCNIGASHSLDLISFLCI